MTNEDLLEIGFQKIPFFTVGNILIYKLSRNRHLSIASVGTPNEVLYLCSTEATVESEKESMEITDLICLHNYDYDGYISLEKIKKIIDIF